jgi:hypothetical protein
LTVSHFVLEVKIAFAEITKLKTGSPKQTLQCAKPHEGEDIRPSDPLHAHGENLAIREDHEKSNVGHGSFIAVPTSSPPY